MSAKRLKGVDLGDAVTRELKAYQEGIVTEMDNALRRNAKKLRNRLAETSPKDTGNYSSGWRVKEIESNTLTQPSTYVVHNAKAYQLTHLLERGHATAGGTKRVEAIPHIGPARDETERELLSEVGEAVERYGDL